MATRKRESQTDCLIREAEESRHLINTDPDSVRGQSLAHLTEGESEALDHFGRLLDRLPTMEKLTEEDYERFDRLSLQLKYEAKYKRLHLMEEMYRLAKEALMAIRYAVDQGEGGSDLAVPAAQFRLLIKDYMNQTREEHGEAPIFSQQQVNIVQRVIIRAPEGVNAKVVDGEVVD